MTIVDIRAALETALKNLTPSFATVWENVEAKPPANDPYQLVLVRFAPPDNDEIGPTAQQRGFMDVTLRYPPGTGSAAAAARAQLIRSTFYRGRSLPAGGGAVNITYTPEIGPGLNSGDRYVIGVTIRFAAQIAA